MRQSNATASTKSAIGIGWTFGQAANQNEEVYADPTSDGRTAVFAGASSAHRARPAPAIATKPDETNMNDMEREWVQAKVDASYERLSGQLAGITAEVSKLTTVIGSLHSAVSDARDESRKASEDARGAREAALGQKSAFWSASIVAGLTVVALVVAILAFGKQSADSAMTWLDKVRETPAVQVQPK